MDELMEAFRPYIDFIMKKLKTKKEREELEATFTSSEDEDSILSLITELEEKFPEYTFEKFSSEEFQNDLVQEEEVEEEEEEEEAEEAEEAEEEEEEAEKEEEEAEKEEEEAEKEEEEAEEEEAEEEVSDDLLPVIPKENPGGGDCFYYSVYGAAAEAGLLPKLKDCLGINTDSRSTFVESFRSLVGERVKGGLPTEDGKDYFMDVLVPQVKSGNWSVILQSYPSWFRARFSKGLPKKESFFKIISEEVQKRGNWVGEIEVTLIENILRECEIGLNKFNHRIPRAVPGEINLWNQGEAHWVHFSFDIPSGYTQSKLYKDLIKKEKERADRLAAQKLESNLKHYSNYEAWKIDPKSRPQFEKRIGYEYNGVIYTKGGKRKTKKTKKSSIREGTKNRFRRTRNRSKK